MIQTIDSKGEREIVLVMGMTGWGKSWWSKLYHKKWRRSLVYDPAMSFPDVIWGDMEDHANTLLGENVEEYISDEQHPAPKRFKFGFVDSEDVAQGGATVFALGNSILFVEECATVFDKGMARMPEWARRLCFYGRHRSCSVVLIAQRPTYIPIDFRSQANRVITFCQHEGSDMDWLQDFFGKERMSKMMTLPKFTCFDYHNGNVTEYSIREKVREVFKVNLDNGTANGIHLAP
jgi:hypothetical protein